MPIINFTLKNLSEHHVNSYFNPEAKLLLISLLVCLLLLGFYMTKRRSSCGVYLLDFACYKPPDAQKSTKQFINEKAKHSGYFSEETVDFMRKALGKSGLGDSTYLPEKAKHSGYFSEETVDFMRKALGKSGLGDSTYLPEVCLKNKFDPCMKESRREMEMSVFGSIDMLLAKTGVRCEEIGILVVNCSIHNTIPSLSSMIVNRYKLEESIISYNLVGMGCSAGLMAIGLAEQLLQVHRDSYALVMSTETITENCYLGDDRSKLLTNCVFRIGGAAILLSNRRSDHHNCKYKLLHAVHTNESSSNRSYNCIVQEEDDAGRRGVTVTKDLINVASTVIESNIATLGEFLLPISEKLMYVTNRMAGKLFPTVNIQPYVPNYRKSVQIFLPHVGGKPVLDGLQRNLGFDETAMEASRMTLYRFGNTSSTSVWYELAYTEAQGRVKKGNRVWQIAYGAGFKCSSVIWRAMRTVDYDEMNPWTEEIGGFPVDVECDDEPLPFVFEPSK